MFKRSALVRAVVAVSLGLNMALAVSSARANLIWGGGNLVTSNTVAAASTLAFNQASPTLITSSTTVPTTAANTTYAVSVVNNVGGTQKLVLMLRYADGSVYAIASDDATTAASAAGSTDNVTLTDSFSFGTVSGQTVVQQTVYVNGTQRNLIWGGGSLVTAFTKSDSTCRNLIWGGGTLTQTGNSGGGDL